MSRFPEDHPLELVRDMRKPTPRQVRKMLHRRCVWLAKKVELDVRAGTTPPGGSFYLSELAATLVAMEAYDREQLARAEPEHTHE